ncbi:hypothetical protein M2149_001375 [Lachnospiraceae bacterium PFB1-21]
MKKKILSLLMVITMVLGVVVVPSSDVEAADNGAVKYVYEDGQFVFFAEGFDANADDYKLVVTYNLVQEQAESLVGGYAEIAVSAKAGYGAYVTKNGAKVTNTVNASAVGNYKVTPTDVAGNPLTYFNGSSYVTGAMYSGPVQVGTSDWVDMPDSISVQSGGKEMEYVLADPNNYRIQVSFGNLNVNVPYIPLDVESLKFYVVCEADDVKIKETELSVPFANGEGKTSFSVEKEIEVNGTKYELIDPEQAKTPVNVSYATAQAEYVYQYKVVKADEKNSYVVKVNHWGVTNQSTKVLLNQGTFTYHEDDKDAYIYTLEKNFTYRTVTLTGEPLVYYFTIEANQENVIYGDQDTIKHTHKEVDGKVVKVYDIQYELVDESKGYTWKVNAIDASSTGQKVLEVLNQVQIKPAVGDNEDGESSAEFEVPYSIKVGDKEYIRGANTPSVLRHVYKEYGEHEINIPYYEVNGAEYPDYDVDVQLMDVKTKKLIKPAEVKVAKASEGGVKLSFEKTFEHDGEEYVMITGQAEEVFHQYYAPQRTRTTWYRNVDDIDSESLYISYVDGDPIYTTEDVVTEGEDAAAPATPPTNTVITDSETGGTQTFNEAGEEITDGIVPQSEGIKDNKTPKATTDEKEAAASAQPNWPVIISFAALALALIIGAAFFATKKKRSATNVEEIETTPEQKDDQN